jgi:quercetin dioxygenase-like cupin family protein
MRRIVPAVLMLSALVALPLVARSARAQEHAHTVALPATLKWAEPAPLPGALLAVVQGDPSKEGQFVYRLKMPAGFRIPPHLHKASENVTVLSGEFFIGLGEKLDRDKGQELPVGAFLSVPPNHPHYAWVGGTETIVQVHGVGPTDLRFVNPEDDPRKKK